MPGGQRNVLPLSLLIAIVLLGSLGGCKPQEEVRIRAIVGAVLIDGTGGPPVSNSVILISGVKILAAGARTNISIPQATEEIDGSGQYIIPAPVEIYVRREAGVYSLAGGQKLAAGTLAAGTTAEEARRQVDGFAAAHRAVVVVEGLEPAAEEAALEQARKDSLPVFARVSKLADVERLVNEGAVGFIGMIADTERIDAAFLAKMRDLRVTWAPALAEWKGETLDIARHNTKRLAAAGVTMAVAGEPWEREMEALVGAGLSPGDAIVAATRNGALVLHRSDQLGTLQAGKRADLLMLPKNPIEDIRNLGSGGREMLDGVWTR